MLRLIKFQDLDITYTCRWESCSYLGSLGRSIEDEEIEEVQSEETEMVEILEQEMRDIEKSLGDNFDEQLPTTISLLSVNAKVDSRGTSFNFG